MPDMIEVEVVFALPEEQAVISVALEDGASVQAAIEESAISRKFPDVDLDALQTGIWGRPVERDARVSDGDRVELYRRLLRDPREARRELAQSGLTMRETGDD